MGKFHFRTDCTGGSDLYQRGLPDIRTIEQSAVYEIQDINIHSDGG